jgi:hypothetical protein
MRYNASSEAEALQVDVFTGVSALVLGFLKLVSSVFQYLL